MTRFLWFWRNLAPEPAEPLRALQTRLWQALPAYDDTRRHQHGFTPHLSVGQAPSVNAARQRIVELTEHWQPLPFRVAAIALIWRNGPPDDRFRVAHTIGLGSDAAADQRHDEQAQEHSSAEINRFW